MRQERRDVVSIVTAKRTITLDEDQYFCETTKAWELWESSQFFPPYKLKRVEKKRVLWVRTSTSLNFVQGENHSANYERGDEHNRERKRS